MQVFEEEGLEYVLVGGYAVSAFKHRFSVDADVVVMREDVDDFRLILEEEGFVETERNDLEQRYGSEFLAFQKTEELPVTVDLLVEALNCRQTDASWSYRYMKQNSLERVIEGSESEIQAVIPEKELFMAIKMHSARLTDCRDVLALMPADLHKLETHLDRGDPDKLGESLKKVRETLKSEGFEDSFKGVFFEKEFLGDAVSELLGFVDQQIDRL
ncbi:MAG: hypothetical protein SVV03_02075 [Candidatus Nanohaloarchaea archaeon]|nr:hypothetical protein [Candidatus Nanohaloarchaea archaeon]